jgi:hypothetical protein
MNGSVLPTEALAVEARPLDARIADINQKNVHKRTLGHTCLRRRR